MSSDIFDTRVFFHLKPSTSYDRWNVLFGSMKSLLNRGNCSSICPQPYYWTLTIHCSWTSYSLTVSSQIISRSLCLCCLDRVMSHLPPLLFRLSSHMGSMPSCRRYCIHDKITARLDKWTLWFYSFMHDKDFRDTDLLKHTLFCVACTWSKYLFGFISHSECYFLFCEFVKCCNYFVLILFIWNFCSYMEYAYNNIKPIGYRLSHDLLVSNPS